MSNDGILIFANNNNHIDYGSIAYISAKFAKKNLEKPVSLVTDEGTRDALLKKFNDVDRVFDQIIIIDRRLAPIQSKRYYDGNLYYKNLKFNNYSRATAYELTPYDRTLVIDCDLLIVNDKLKLVWESQEDFMMSSKHYDLAIDREYFEFTRISDFSIDFYWATAFYFVKNENNKIFFDLCKHIIDNYDYYRFVYRIDNSMMRNDYVFSIAQHIMNGFGNISKPAPLPDNINYILDRDELFDIVDDKTFIFLVSKKNYNGEYTLVKTQSKNVHVMNKWAISRHENKLLEVIGNV